MDGEQAIEAEEQDRGACSGVALKDRNEIDRETRLANEGAADTGLVEGREPTTESAGVAIPGAARGLAQETRGVSTEQRASIHGEAGHATAGGVERCDETSFASDDPGPELKLLR